MKPVYKRVLLKLSGQAFSGSADYGIERETVASIAQSVKELVEAGVHVAAVVGGGNILRGAEAASTGMDRATADYSGMVATVINALVFQDTLESMGVPTRVQSAIEMREVAEPYIRRRAIRHLDLGRVVIFAAGTGNPFFTTDTAAVLRGVEVGAEALLKLTNVDGIYDSDPKHNPDAKLFTQLSHQEVLIRGLRVMDQTAFSLAMENELPIIVMNIGDPENMRRAVAGERVGTLVGRTSDG